MKICDKSICKPIEIIYKSYFEKGCFPSESKKANVVPIHKKSDKKLLRNYHPILLLPISLKILEKLLHNSMLDFFTENTVIVTTRIRFQDK